MHSVHNTKWVLMVSDFATKKNVAIMIAKRFFFLKANPYKKKRRYHDSQTFFWILSKKSRYHFFDLSYQPIFLTSVPRFWHKTALLYR